MTDEFTDILGRTDAAAELPEQLAEDLVLGTIRSSTALALGQQVPTTVRDSRIPVLTESRKYQDVVPKGKPASSSSTPRTPAPGAVT